MAVQCKVRLRGGIEVADAYVRIRAVNAVKKDREGTSGHYLTYDVEAFKDKATADAKGDPLPVDGGLGGKIRNLETATGLTGDLLSDGFGLIYADLKNTIAERGFDVLANIKDV